MTWKFPTSKAGFVIRFHHPRWPLDRTRDALASQSPSSPGWRCPVHHRQEARPPAPLCLLLGALGEDSYLPDLSLVICG